MVQANRLLMPVDHVTSWLFRGARNRIADVFGFALKLIRRRYGCAAGCAAWALPRRYVLMPIGLCPWSGLGPIVPLPSVNFRLPIGLFRKRPIGNWHWAIGNLETHLLPHGGTDFTGSACCAVVIVQALDT